MSWLEIKLTVPGEIADELSDECLELGAVSVALDNAGPDTLAGSVFEPGPGATIVWERVVISAYWNASDELRPISAGLAKKIQEKGVFAEVSAIFRADDDFPSAPAQPVARLQFGEQRLWLVPRDTAQASLAEFGEAAVLKLDPGLAFGSGLHPTTQLCLDYLARLSSLESFRVLDFGCGSGVLALGALALGARAAHGVDHDPQALVATLDNAAYNDLSEGLQVFMPSDVPEDARYEVVVANILANPLIELAPEISARVAPGGALVMAGLLADQADDVMRAYPEFSFDPLLRYQGSAIARDADSGAGGLVASADEDWVRLQGTKRRQ